MGDAFGSFLQSMEAGKAKTAARKKAEFERLDELNERKRDQYNKDRTHGFKEKQHTQVVRGAAEDQIQRLEQQIASEDWDGSPQMTMSLLSEAAKIDRDYGPVLGKSVEGYFAKKLNLGGDNPQARGGQGPPSPGGDSPLRGFMGPEQKAKYDEQQKTRRTQQILGQLEDQAVEHLKQYATDANGVIDPRIAGGAFLEFRSQKMTELGKDFDYKLLDEALDNIADTMGKALPGLAKLTEDPENVKANMDKTSKDLSYWIKSRYGQDTGFGNFEYFDTGKAPGMNMVERAGQRLVLLGLDTPTIKTMLAQRFVGEDGMWPGGNKKEENDAALHLSPPDFAMSVQKVFDAGVVDPRDVEVVFDPASGKGGLIDLATGQWVGGAPGQPLFGASSRYTSSDAGTR